MSDAELVRGLCERDRAAFSVLYDRYGTITFSVLLGVTGRQEAAERLLEELFLRVPALMTAYNSTYCSLATWMVIQARNAGVSYMRSAGQKPRVFDTENPRL